jgi:hypothetical protein
MHLKLMYDEQLNVEEIQRSAGLRPDGLTGNLDQPGSLFKF